MEEVTSDPNAQENPRTKAQAILEFLEKSKQLVHPFDLPTRLPPNVADTIVAIGSLGPKQLIETRRWEIEFWKGRVQELIWKLSCTRGYTEKMLENHILAVRHPMPRGCLAATQSRLTRQNLLLRQAGGPEVFRFDNDKPVDCHGECFHLVTDDTTLASTESDKTEDNGNEWHQFE